MPNGAPGPAGTQNDNRQREEQWQQANHQGVVMQGGREVAMKEVMGRAESPAAGALQAGPAIQQAFGIEGGLFRRETIQNDGRAERQHWQDEQWDDQCFAAIHLFSLVAGDNQDVKHGMARILFAQGTRFWYFLGAMKLTFRRFDLRLAHRWTIASSVGPGGGGGTDFYKVVFVELTDGGITGIGEAAPSSRYKENVDSVLAFLEKVDAKRLSFDDVPGSMRYLDSISKGDFAPKCALNIALMDGAARKARKPIYDFLKLGFQENRHITSFSIGIDNPDVIRKKVLEAEGYPVLKLKVGSADDEQNIRALREAAPDKTVRVDANEAWKTKEEALKQIEKLARDPHIEFVEQPMPATTPLGDFAWLKARTPIPIMGDESYRSGADAEMCAEAFHSVNVKLVKTGGISGAYEALQAARKLGLKTMIGCMIESSVLITAAAHLAELTNYLDIDGNLLINNDPYLGATGAHGVISFASAKDPIGLRVMPR